MTPFLRDWHRIRQSHIRVLTTLSGATNVRFQSGILRITGKRVFLSPRKLPCTRSRWWTLSSLLRAEDVDPLLVSDPDVGPLVAIQVAHRDLGPYSRIRVHQVRDEFHPVRLAPFQLKPVENRWLIRSRVPAAMGPPALPGDKVRQPIAIKSPIAREWC